MHIRLSLLICLCASVGCVDIGTITPLFDQGTDGGACPKPPDLAPVPAKCAAAKGLGGDVLNDLCLDMDKIDTAGLTGRGFNLAAPALSCGGWEVAGNKLQPKSVNTSGMVDCAFALPNISIDGKYSRLMLALVHQTTLNTATQQARIEISKSPPPSLPIWIWDNAPTTAVDQRTILELDVVKLPNSPNAQAIFHLTAPMGSLAPTWTITSLAVLAQTAQ